MTAEDILKIRSLGEVSKVQFKERLMDKYDIGCELAAFSNTHGGQLIVGINDKTGEVNPLSYQEVQETTNLLSNIASENVVPGILLTIDTAPVEGGTIVVATIKNALVHRSLNWKAPIRIFIFDNRIEIHSPGTLPNGLSVDDIVAGTSMPRNNFLFANAIYLLPYTGAGSGIQRALGQDKRLSFSNNEKLHEFTIIIERDNVQVDVNLDTKKNNSDTNSDTFGNIPNTFEGDFNIIPNTSDVTPNTFSDTLDAIPNTSDKTPNTKMDKLSGKQKDVINFCSIPRNSREILERVGVKYHSSNIKRYITELVNRGFLERTIPDQPFDSNQKYRKKLK